jgi:pimeloyl-ACP methyl ester carboxylesterase
MVQRLKLLRVPFVRRRLVHVVDALECTSQAEDLVGQLDVPIFGVHCDDDPLVPPASLRLLHKKARNRKSRFQAFPEGGHDVLAAHGGQGLERDIARFITQEKRD